MEKTSCYFKKNGKSIKPVNSKNCETRVPKNTICRHCSAPAKYLYYNDGKKRTQIKCKVCGNLSQVHPHHRLKAKYFCPHCQRPLYLWKKRKDAFIYKCDNDTCPLFLKNNANLNFREKILAKIKPFQFKLRYQYREYHFTNEQLAHSAPKKGSSIFDIRNSLNTFCLILSFHISLGISARKTAFILRNIFSRSCSYQTVLNYTQSAAYYCHNFNLTHKGDVDDTQVGDEAYIKIKGKQNYAFFFLSPKRRKISAYHIDDNRDTLPATVAMNEAIRTSKLEQEITLISDGNPSYPAGIHFINQSRDSKLTHKKVIGLQNLDSESQEFRPFKQLIERLNRTYKFHTRAACGFNTKNGAVALTTLFATHYNFLRPHSALDYQPPIQLDTLTAVDTLQGKWAKLLSMAFDLPVVN